MSALSELLRQAKDGRSIDTITDQAARRGHPINRATVAKYLAGDHGPRPAERTLLALSAGLGVDVRHLRRCVGAPGGELGPYRPVAESARLSHAQRAAIDQLIKTMVGQVDQTMLTRRPIGRSDQSQEAGQPSVSGGNPATTGAMAFGGGVYVGEPASAELPD